MIKSDLVSQKSTRPAPLFQADALALDFLNSIATPTGERIDWLTDGEDLLFWLREAGLITADVSENVQSRVFPGELDSVAAEARALREWFRAFVLAHKGKPLGKNVLKELLPLNDLLARDETYLSIGIRTPHVPEHQSEKQPVSALQSSRQRRWRTPSLLLLPLAETMADLVCSADFRYVKKCEGPTCTLLVLDTTQRHARRWCSMGICGNRAKQAAHRNRLKQQ